MACTPEPLVYPLLSLAPTPLDLCMFIQRSVFSTSRLATRYTRSNRFSALPKYSPVKYQLSFNRNMSDASDVKELEVMDASELQDGQQSVQSPFNLLIPARVPHDHQRSLILQQDCRCFWRKGSVVKSKRTGGKFLFCPPKPWLTASTQRLLSAPM